MHVLLEKISYIFSITKVDTMMATFCVHYLHAIEYINLNMHISFLLYNTRWFSCKIISVYALMPLSSTIWQDNIFVYGRLWQACFSVLRVFACGTCIYPRVAHVQYYFKISITWVQQEQHRGSGKHYYPSWALALRTLQS